MENITIPEVLLVSLEGMAVVFAVLVILMTFIKIMTFFVKLGSKKSEKVEKVSTNDKTTELAKGSCGNIAMFDVPDKIAAMAMAIVADEMKVPLNELRFISIKEVEE